MAKKKTKAADANADAAVQVEGASNAPTTDANGPTLTDLSTGYLKYLDDTASAGTRFSYALDLKVALDEIGAETPLADLTPARVLEFFISDRVMRTKTGVDKAPPTIAKTRRVLRQALQWAEASKLIEKAPLPEDAATH